jgi:hypothetical protein
MQSFSIKPRARGTPPTTAIQKRAHEGAKTFQWSRCRPRRLSGLNHHGGSGIAAISTGQEEERCHGSNIHPRNPLIVLRILGGIVLIKLASCTFKTGALSRRIDTNLSEEWPETVRSLSAVTREREIGIIFKRG